MIKKSRVAGMLRDRKGQGLVEYALLVAGIALVGILAVSMIGEKTADMLDLVAVVLPGADQDDNGPIGQGHLIENAKVGGNIQLDDTTIAGGNRDLGTNLTGQNVGNNGLGLIVDAVPQSNK